MASPGSERDGWDTERVAEHSHTNRGPVSKDERGLEQYSSTMPLT